MTELELLEAARQKLQNMLDAERTLPDRNRLGQFATPTPLARAIVRATRHELSDQPLTFLEPAFGIGSFYAAVLAELPDRLERTLGYEIDPRFVEAAEALWEGHTIMVRQGDFTQASAQPQERVNLLIGNPPYVRHHHIDPALKTRLKQQVLECLKLHISGLAGLYCYFVMLADPWLVQSGLAVWLLPGEFLEVNYGAAVKKYLLEHGTLLRIHRFEPEDGQFPEALVTSVVVWFRKEPPSAEHEVAFTSGGDVEAPTKVVHIKHHRLVPSTKWPRYFSSDASKVSVPSSALFGAFFKVRRGIATGANAFFIRPRAQFQALGIPEQFLKPILPSPRALNVEYVQAKPDGYPAVSPELALLDCPWSEQRIESEAPELWAYLMRGKSQGIHTRYLCRHRKLWYRQEQRLPAPFVCNYMGRQHNGGPAFRFMLNRSNAIAANVYLMLYPTERLAECLAHDATLYRKVWEGLQQVLPATLVQEGRTYGGGLQKLEPKELRNVPLPWMEELLS